MSLTEPLIWWRRRRWERWLLAGSVVGLLALAWFGSRSQKGLWPDSALWFVYFAAWLSFARNQSIPGIYVLAEGVLAVAQPQAPVRYIPLAAVQSKETAKGWYLRWHDGQRRQAQSVTPPAPLRPAFASALAAAAETGGALPVTSAAAARLIGLGEPAQPTALPWLVTGGAAVCAALTVWLHQPLFLAPVAAALIWVGFVPERRYVLISGELRLVAPAGVVTRVALRDITGVTRRWRRAVVRTRLPDRRQVGLHLPASAELVRTIERHLLGADRLEVPEAPPANKADITQRPPL